MAHYLLSIYQPDGGVPSAEILDKVMTDIAELNQELRRAGAWVFTAGLHQADTSTVVRNGDNEALLTDGPFTEGKEHVGGLWIIQAPDLDAALDWGRKAAAATTLPIEVRPVAYYEGT
ncbi:YciI family protein [Arthrobacter sp. ISL-30]|uniref:YciI family protein n=1 Tax=Arthrobacter sp. ISL-30 TaxID=2819109 RepID=UPI001BE6A9FA|nr:YciI family protein [Arthrobacter sp. ISL-30]MBT2514926.1 hypothetical protein [Arthrobacter sp. ISL-30]